MGGNERSGGRGRPEASKHVVGTYAGTIAKPGVAQAIADGGVAEIVVDLVEHLGLGEEVGTVHDPGDEGFGFPDGVRVANGAVERPLGAPFRIGGVGSVMPCRRSMMRRWALSTPAWVRSTR